MDVFAVPEKIQHGGDRERSLPQGAKWQSKEMSHDFVRGHSVAETCFSHWGYQTYSGWVASLSLTTSDGLASELDRAHILAQTKQTSNTIKNIRERELT